MDKIFSNTKSVWSFLSKTNKPIIVYGMGNGSDKLFDKLLSIGATVSAVMASDNFVRGQSFRGYTVQKLCDIEKTYSDFIILIAFGSQLAPVIDNIKRIAQNHLVLAPQISVYNDEAVDEDFILKNLDAIKKAYTLLADEKSKFVYKNILTFMYCGELSPLFAAQSDKDEAFKNILSLNQNEDYLDLGAYKGDTIEEFLHYCNGSYNSITALEPDVKTYKKLCGYAGSFKNTLLLQNGVYSENTTLGFSCSKGRGSAVSGKKTTDVTVITVDSISKTRPITYLKADVEGLEREMLIGAKETLKNQKPKLNIAAYHKNSDIFTLPILINEINPDYKIYLRHHPYIPAWDTNLYCV